MFGPFCVKCLYDCWCVLHQKAATVTHISRTVSISDAKRLMLVKMSSNQLSQLGSAGKAHRRILCSEGRELIVMHCDSTEAYNYQMYQFIFAEGKNMFAQQGLWQSRAPTHMRCLYIYQLTAQHTSVREQHFKICWQVRGLHISDRRRIKPFDAPEGAEPSLINCWLMLMTTSLKTIWKCDVRKCEPSRRL